jgi:phosphate-selective porin OprO/OprP
LLEASEMIRKERGAPLARRWSRELAGGLLIASIAFTGAFGALSARAARPLGELEEPGEVERTQGAAEEAAKVEKAAAEIQPEEAEEILPDSEAVDPTIEEAPAQEAASPDADALEGMGEEEVELQPGEAQTILPDSEAVDETIEAHPEATEQAAEEKKGEPAKAEEAEAPSEPRWTIRWQNAFIVEREDDPRYQFLFGGRIQNDWGLYAPDDDLEDSIGGDGSGVKFRRARIYFQGQFFRYGFFKAEYELSSAGDETEGTDFADLYMGLNLPEIGLIRVGHFREPISLQIQNSSNFLSFNERASIRAFSPGRNVGIMLNRNFFVRDSTFSVSFNRRTDDLGEGFSSQEDYRITSRFTFLPYFEEGGKRLLHLEAGYSHQFADKNEGTRYDVGAANDFSPTLVDTGDLAVNDVDLFNVGLAVVRNSISLQGEATIAVPYDGISEDPVFWGLYAELSYWLTGEHRRYLRGRGVFSRVVPRSRFEPESGQWGALEIAGRYSWLDLSNDGIRGGTLEEWSLGLNWVLFSNMRINNNYVLSRTHDRMGTQSGIAHSWVTRFQMDF